MKDDNLLREIAYCRSHFNDTKPGSILQGWRMDTDSRHTRMSLIHPVSELHEDLFVIDLTLLEKAFKKKMSEEEKGSGISAP